MPPSTAAQPAFENPDHVAIVVHNYRWRLGLAEGEPKYDAYEKQLAAAPSIHVPTITLEGDANGAPHPEPAAYAQRFTANISTAPSQEASATTSRRRPHEPSPRP